MPVLLLVVLTALFAATVPGFVQTWRGESTVAELPRYGLFARVRRQKDRRRGGPAMLVAGYLFCLSGWATLLVDGDTDQAHPASVALFLTLTGATVAAFVGAATVVLFNRPRFLVPPHLRQQWGSVRARRAQTGRHRSPSS